MRNKKIYDKYAITGFPCHFYTMEACDKFNNKIAKYCNRLPEGAADLTPFQLRLMRLYIIYLNVYDAVLSVRQNNK